MRFEGGVPIVTVEPKGRIGSAFDDFLKDEGIFEDVQAGALKSVPGIGVFKEKRDQRVDFRIDPGIYTLPPARDSVVRSRLAPFLFVLR